MQRAVHLVAGVMLVAYVYAAPQLGAAFVTAVRWIVVPALVASGVALWKWARIRTLTGRWKG